MTSDVSVFYEIFALRIYKIPKTEIISIVDLGANVGYASIYFSHFCPNAHIVAVEPESSNYQALVENTQSLKNIDCVHAAIWPQETEFNVAKSQGVKLELSVSRISPDNRWSRYQNANLARVNGKI